MAHQIMASLRRVGRRVAAPDLVQRTLATFARTTFITTPLPTSAAAAAAVGYCTIAIMMVLAAATPAFFTSLDDQKESAKNNQHHTIPCYRIEVGFMQKLAAKSYLHFRQDSKDDSWNTVNNNVNNNRYEHRPPGVPPTLRILTVDLPEVRDAFRQGTCQLKAQHVYPDGAAPHRVVHVPFQDKTVSNTSANSNTDTNTADGIQLQVQQKAWVKSMVQCVVQDTDNVGVQVLEANTGALNPHNLRKTHQFGKLRYDPGKYATINRKKSVVVQEAAAEKVAVDAAAAAVAGTDLVRATAEDELQAPWNQHAWTEEVMLRIGGKVGFGAPMEAAGQWSRYFYGSTFRSTVPSSRSGWRWLGNRRDAAGMDGTNDSMTWASNKPHAVIANGAALQLVPNSLRLLQKACRDSNVPLYVIRDPRVWGGNTHTDLGDVLRELRKTVKSRIVSASLQQAVGTAFQRGRWLGKLQADTKWQTTERTRKAKEAVLKTKERLRRASKGHKKKEEIDWRQLDEIALEEKLAGRGVIHREKGQKNESMERTYTSGMVALAQRCVTDQQQKEKDTKDQGTPAVSTEDDADPSTAPQAV